MQASIDVRQAFEHIETLIHALEDVLDPAAREAARELVQALLHVHGVGLERLLQHTYDAAGQEAVDALVEDDLVSSMLLLHGLHPLPLETRVLRALDSVRPYLHSHGGGVDMLGVDPDGTVRLRLEGSCHGCPSSLATLRYAIEEAVFAAAPDVASLHVEGAVAPEPVRLDGFIPLHPAFESDGAARPTRTWTPLEGPSSFENGTVRMQPVEGQPVVFCRVDGLLYAYHEPCPQCEEGMGAAFLDGHRLTCPSCGSAYDVVRAGRSLDGSAARLEPYPLLEDEGRVRIHL